MGMGCGIYVAQNYNVPNVKKLFNTYVFLAKHLEETYRKPKKEDWSSRPPAKWQKHDLYKWWSSFDRKRNCDGLYSY